MGESKKIDWSNMSEAVPAYFTTVMMPFSYRCGAGASRKGREEAVVCCSWQARTDRLTYRATIHNPQHHQRHPLRHRHVPRLLPHHRRHHHRPRVRPPWPFPEQASRGRRRQRERQRRWHHPDPHLPPHGAPLPVPGQPADGAVRARVFLVFDFGGERGLQLFFVPCVLIYTTPRPYPHPSTPTHSRPSLLLSKGQVDELDQEQRAEEQALQGHFLPIATVTGDYPHAAVASQRKGAAAGGGGYGTVGGGIASSL